VDAASIQAHGARVAKQIQKFRFHKEKPSDLTAEECKALIEILGLKNITLRYGVGSGLFQGVMTAWDISKKQEFYNGLTEEKAVLADC